MNEWDLGTGRVTECPAHSFGADWRGDRPSPTGRQSQPVMGRTPDSCDVTRLEWRRDVRPKCYVMALETGPALPAAAFYPTPSRGF